MSAAPAARKKLNAVVLEAYIPRAKGKVYCKMTVGKGPVQSTEKRDPPSWSGAFEFTVGDETHESFRVSAVQAGGILRKEEELGWCDVLLTDLPKDTPKEVTLHLIEGCHDSPTDTLKVVLTASGFGWVKPPPALAAVPGATRLQSIVPYLEKAAPVMLKVGALIARLEPTIVWAWEWFKWVWVQYNLEALCPAFFGIVMMFFGGYYMTTIAAIEAYRMCGWERTHRCIVMIYKNLKQARQASLEDDNRDLDNDGVADVKQMTPAQLARHKLSVVLAAVDPITFSDALTGIYAGTLAVIATLRTRFARAITLGSSIGDVLNATISPMMVPVISFVLPPQHKRWAPVLVMYTIKGASMSIAWSIFRMFSAFHSAVRGAQLLQVGVLKYCILYKILTPRQTQSIFYNMISLGLAGVGFMWQLGLGFQLPFPLNVFLFPLTVVEYVFMWLVNYA